MKDPTSPLHTIYKHIETTQLELIYQAMDSTHLTSEKHPDGSPVLPEGTLRPITSNATGRYDVECM